MDSCAGSVLRTCRPRQYQPANQVRASYALPLTRGVQAAREVVAGAGFAQVAGLLAVGVAYGVAGYLLFRLLESWSRRGGMQEAY